jgi:hypothetical protein
MSDFRTEKGVSGPKNSSKMARFLAKNTLFLPIFDLFLSRVSAT